MDVSSLSNKLSRQSAQFRLKVDNVRIYAVDQLVLIERHRTSSGKD